MKTLRVSAFLFISICFSVVVFAAGKKDIPPWMENIDASGRNTYLVPKGAKRQVIGSQVLVEPPNEYVARRFYEMEAYLERRLKKIEKDQENLRSEIEDLRRVADELADDSKTTEEMIQLEKDFGKLENRIEFLETLRSPERSVEGEDGSIEVIEGVEDLTSASERQDKGILEE